jgi:hypothetical protein
MSSLCAFGVDGFGCKIRVETPRPELLEILNRYIFPAFCRVDISPASANISLRVIEDSDRFDLLLNKAKVASVEDPMSLVLASIKALDEAVIYRLEGLRAVHAGAVLFGNKALLLPGCTHAGKSSLVAELLQRGATYLSDEYALVDSVGRIHPYPRPLLLRNGRPKQSPVLPAELNSCFATGPASVRWILSLEYRPECRWSVRELPQSEGLIILLRNTPHTLEESPGMVDLGAAEHILQLVG